MTFHVPVRVHVLGLVLLDTSRLDLFEAPLWQICVAGAKIAVQ